MFLINQNINLAWLQANSGGATSTSNQKGRITPSPIKRKTTADAVETTSTIPPVSFPSGTDIITPSAQTSTVELPTGALPGMPDINFFPTPVFDPDMDGKPNPLPEPVTKWKSWWEKQREWIVAFGLTGIIVYGFWYAYKNQ